MTQPPRIIAYTDGGCRNNPGIGGWGFLLIDRKTGAALERMGGAPHTTNNRMEMTAAIEVLRTVKGESVVEIRSDSRYLVDMATSWMKGWKKKGWRKKGGAIQNLDLVKDLDALLQHREVQWRWVRAHVGEPGNEHADGLANRAMDAIEQGTDPSKEHRYSQSPITIT